MLQWSRASWFQVHCYQIHLFWYIFVAVKGISTFGRQVIWSVFKLLSVGLCPRATSAKKKAFKRNFRDAGQVADIVISRDVTGRGCGLCARRVLTPVAGVPQRSPWSPAWCTCPECPQSWRALQRRNQVQSHWGPARWWGGDRKEWRSARPVCGLQRLVTTSGAPFK